MSTPRKDLSLPAEPVFTTKLPSFVYQDFFKENKEHKESAAPQLIKKWSALTSDLIGQVLQYNDSYFLHIYNIKEETSSCLQMDAPIDLIPWPNNCFATLSGSKLIVWYSDATHILRRRHIVELNKIQGEYSAKPFPDGKHFLLKSGLNLSLVDVENGERQSLGLNFIETLAHAQLFNDKLILSCYWEAPRDPASKTIHLDFKKKRWYIASSESMHEFGHSHRFISSENSPIFAEINSTNEEKTSLTIYENTSIPHTYTVKAKITTTRCHNNDDNTYTYSMSPQGLLYYTDQYYNLRLYNYHVQKDFDLGINVISDAVLMTDHGIRTLSKIGNDFFLKTYAASSWRFVAETDNALSTNFSNDITNLISSYAYSFFAVHSNKNVKLKNIELKTLLLHLENTINNVEASSADRDKASYDCAALQCLKQFINFGNPNDSIFSIVQNILNSYPKVSGNVKNLLNEFGQIDSKKEKPTPPGPVRFIRPRR